MLLHLAPCDKLKGIVEDYFQITFEQSDRANEVLIIPDGSCGLVFFLDGSVERSQLTLDENNFSTLSGGFIAGINTKAVKFKNATKNLIVFGAKLRPSALYQLFNIPASEFTDRMFSFESLLSDLHSIIEEQLYAKESFPERKDVLEHLFSFLLGQNKSKEIFFPEFYSKYLMTRPHGTENLKSVSSHSYKTIERKYVREIGVMPKVFSRILRFNKTLRYAESFNNLSDIAYQAGYYDQAHFIKEVKLFTGVLPKTFYKTERGQIERAHREIIRNRFAPTEIV